MSLRQIERESIRAFLELHQGKISGRVLDYGSGQQPYRGLVEQAGGEYHPYDRPEFPGAVSKWTTAEPNGFYDTVVCTQVIQYAPGTQIFLRSIHAHLKTGGWLLMTGPTNWAEVETADLHRFTQAGIRYELAQAGFVVESVSPRAYHPGEKSLSMGWGAVAQA